MTSYNIESFSNEKEKANVMRWQKPSGNYRACLVCGRYSHFYRYTGEMCCEACKKFYRRTVAQQFVPPCLTNLQCDVTKEKCRHCRYQKCLSVEIDRRFLKIKSSEKFHRCLDGLKQIEQPFKKIWDSSQPLPEAYTNQHQTLAGLLQDNYNLLSNADQFPEEPVGCCNKAQFLYEVETNGLFSLNVVNIQYIKEWFLVVELAKTFSFIKKLTPNDQICHLNYVDLPARHLIMSFYSYLMNAKTLTRKSGLELIAVLEAKQVRGDQRLRTLLIHTTCHMVQKMSDCGLVYEEFLLLLAIILSNSNADGLSPIGRKKLYQESIHYSKTLLNLLQCKFGQIGGAQKFASLMEMLNLAIGMKFKCQEIVTYMEVFYAKQALNAAHPQIMHSI